MVYRSKGKASCFRLAEDKRYETAANQLMSSVDAWDLRFHPDRSLPITYRGGRANEDHAVPIGDAARDRDVRPQTRWYPQEIGDAVAPQQQHRTLVFIDGHQKAVPPFVAVDEREIKEWTCIPRGGSPRFL
jgi:hypothetical protein